MSQTQLVHERSITSKLRPCMTNSCSNMARITQGTLQGRFKPLRLDLVHSRSNNSRNCKITSRIAIPWMCSHLCHYSDRLQSCPLYLVEIETDSVAPKIERAIIFILCLVYDCVCWDIHRHIQHRRQLTGKTRPALRLSTIHSGLTHGVPSLQSLGIYIEIQNDIL